MYLPDRLESPSPELTAAGPLGMPEQNYVTSPKVLEIPQPDIDKRIALGWLGLLVVSGLVLRLMMFALGPSAASERAMLPDTALQSQLAAALITEQTFGYPANNETASSGIPARDTLIGLRESVGQLEAPVGSLTPETYILPGYPMLIGLVDAVGGPTSWLLLIQCALGALLTLAVFGLVKNCVNKTGPAIVAAAIVAIHPAAILAPLSVSHEVLFGTLLVAGLWAASRRTTPMAILAGAALSAAALVQPISIFLAPAVGLWMILSERKAATVGLALTVTVLGLAGPGIWMARNVMIDHGPRISTANTVSLAHAAASVEAHALGQDAPHFDDTLQSVFLTGEETNNDLLAGIDAQSRQTLLDHPQAFGEVMSLTAWKLMTDHKVDDLYRLMGLTYEPIGFADFFAGDTDTFTAEFDTQQNGFAAEAVALGWMGLNTLVLLGTVIGIATMVARRQGTALMLTLVGLIYVVWLAMGHGIAAWQTTALIFAAIACGSVFAAKPKRIKEPKAKKPKRSRKQKRDDQVFDIEAPEAEPMEERTGLAARPI